MRRKTKKKIIIIGVCILVVLLLIVGIYFYGLRSVSKHSEKVEFTVMSGTNTKEIINNLYDAKLIRSKSVCMVYIKLHKNIVIKAGKYELNRKYNTKEIFNILSNGDVINDTFKITFVEGKRLVDYVKVISDKTSYSEEEILEVLSDKDYLNELIKRYDFLSTDILNSDIYYPLEGYLFPATYEYYKDASIKTIIEKMLDKTKNVLDNSNASIKESDKSIHEIMTIASIIENESVFDEDRSIVSEVIYKRLSMNMSLGMDVTTYYGVRKTLGEALTQSDLNSVNAYNTRNTSFIGLPVGPICNPSEKSIKAALNPSDDNYIYFYADIKTGKLYFAENYQEFQELIRKYS